MNAAFFLTPKSGVAYIYSDSTFRQGLEKMRYHGYTVLPVLDSDGRYVGTIGQGEFLRTLIDVGGADMVGCEALCISEILPSESLPPVSITAGAEELFERLLDCNFVSVVDDRGMFMGIVTRRRVLEYLREEAKKKFNL